MTASNAEILHQHRFLGNKAVHELEQPSREELRLAIEIIEHTFETVYSIPQKGRALKAKTKIRKAYIARFSLLKSIRSGQQIPDILLK